MDTKSKSVLSKDRSFMTENTFLKKSTFTQKYGTDIGLGLGQSATSTSLTSSRNTTSSLKSTCLSAKSKKDATKEEPKSAPKKRPQSSMSANKSGPTLMKPSLLQSSLTSGSLQSNTFSSMKSSCLSKPTSSLLYTSSLTSRTAGSSSGKPDVKPATPSSLSQSLKSSLTTSSLVYSSSTKTSLNLTNTRSSLLTSSFTKSTGFGGALSGTTGLGMSLSTKSSLISTPSSFLRTTSIDKSKVTAKRTGKGATDQERVLQSDIEIPEYEFKNYDDNLEEEDEGKLFVPPQKDQSLLSLSKPVHDIEAIKRSLINAVSGSLIRAPDFKEAKDPFRLELIAVAERVSYYDSEFILKVALYTRNELNIRTTANFLLAFASNNRGCRPYLRKYYSASIRLPSDWIDVAEQYQAFYDPGLNFGSLPAALRRVMTLKFPDFDKYQLGKYNKDSSSKKKKVPTATLR